MKKQFIWAEENKEVFYGKGGMRSWTAWGVEFKNIFYSSKVYGVINVRDGFAEEEKICCPWNLEYVVGDECLYHILSSISQVRTL